MAPLPPHIQSALDALPASAETLREAVSAASERGAHATAQAALQEAWRRTGAWVWLRDYCVMLMNGGAADQAFEVLRGSLDERAPHVETVLLACEALLLSARFELALHYIEYAEQIGAATDRLARLRALQAQLLKRRGALSPPRAPSTTSWTEPSSLPAHLFDETTRSSSNFDPQTVRDASPPEEMPTVSIKLGDTSATALTEPLNHPDERDSATEHLTRAAIVPASLIAHSDPGMDPTDIQSPDTIQSALALAQQHHHHHQRGDARALAERALTARDLVDATIPFQRAHVLARFATPQGVVDALNQEEEEEELPLLDLELEPSDETGHHAATEPEALNARSTPLHDHELYRPLEDREGMSQSQVRDAYFGDAPSFGAPSPPINTPSFGAQPAPAPRADALDDGASSAPEGERAGALPLLPQIASSARLKEETTESSASPREPRRSSRRRAPWLTILGALCVAALAMLAITSIATDRWLTTSLLEHRAASLARGDDGTYEGALEAYEALGEARDTAHPLGEGVERAHAAIHALVPIYRAPKLRQELTAELAYRAAWIEWHYEAPGTRQAEALIERAAEELPEGSHRLELARVYADLADAPERAWQVAERALKRYEDPASRVELLLATSRAAYGAGRPDRGAELLAASRDLLLDSADRAHQRVELLNLYRDPEFSPTMETLLAETKSPLRLHLIRAAQTQIDLAALSQSASQIHAASADPDPLWHSCYLARQHHALGLAALAEQDFPRALKSFEQAHELCAAHPDYGRALADHFLHTGDHASAQALLEELLKDHPDAAFEIPQAELALARGELKRVEAILSPLIARAHPEALLLEAHAAMLSEEFERAKARALEAKAQDAFYGVPQATLYLIEALTRADQVDLMERKLDALIAKQEIVSPRLKAIRSRLKLERAEHVSDPQLREDLFQGAQQALTDVIASSLYEDQARYALCELYLAQRRYRAAGQACEDARETNAESIQGKIARATLLLERGDSQGAKELVVPLDAKRPDFLPLAELTVRAYLDRGDLGVAARRLEEMAKRHPKSLRIGLLRGRLAFAQGRYEQAITALEPIAGHASRPVEAQLFLAYARMRHGERDEALSERLEAHTNHPRWGPYAWLALGELRRHQGRLQEAQRSLDRADELLKASHLPDWYQAELLTQRALALQAELGWDDPRLKRLIGRARRNDTGTHAGLKHLLALQAQHGPEQDKERAILLFEQALTIEPHHCPSLQALNALNEQALVAGRPIADAIRQHCP